MNEVYIQKLLRLIREEVITTDDIKDPDYKAEIESRPNAA